MNDDNKNLHDLSNAIAIVGMSGRFPGAKSASQFWENQRNGVEAISQFTAEELEIANAPVLAQDSRYVRARSILDNVDLFDAAFFGIYPKEAELMDPQHRVFLECCWEAIEDAGYDPLDCPSLTGVYAGCAPSTYFLRNVCSDPNFIENYTSGYQVANYAALLGSNGDFLATRVSYKLNLKGPAFTMLAGCSTSLIAICQACQALQAYQCDLALAGGISITFPQKRGYLYQEGGMVSPDGHCRAFDEQANGTVFGSGSGVVVLKRFEDAVRDGDQIHAVIRGYAVNNDGGVKVGYTAPSVEGQANVIAMAQAAAGVTPDSIGYLEAHGTGTPLGDPIEVAALTQAFRAGTPKRSFCVLGTAKSNVGHLDIAAGVTGLINAVQILRHKVLPPTLHFQKPNPKLKIEDSPFYVNRELRDWKTENNAPRRAGVSAFGVGGTNAHVVLEESPATESSTVRRDSQLLVLSAKTPAALAMASTNLAEHLKNQTSLNLADVAHTLQVGRHSFEHRRFVVASDAVQAIRALDATGSKHSGFLKSEQPPVVFMFPGQGAQYQNMGSELYASEPEYRKWVDECCEILKPALPRDLREVLYPANENSEESKKLLTSTAFAQPAIFVTEFALAKLWMSWGVLPDAMIGHSIGEFVAACLAGVFSLQDALHLVATRGRMMQDLPSGSMLAVRLPEAQLRPLLNANVALAAINSPALCVVSGPTAEIEKLEKSFGDRKITSRRLHTSHAFHSPMMDPVIDPFTEVVKQISLHESTIPYVSGVSGQWVTVEQTSNPRYWATHLREPVRFADGVASLANLPNAILLEVGPGNTLNTLALQHPEKRADQLTVSSLPDAARTTKDIESMLNAVGQMWIAGLQPDWNAIHQCERLHRVSLPSYPFERKRYWIEPKAVTAQPGHMTEINVPDLQAESVSPADVVEIAGEAEKGNEFMMQTNLGQASAVSRPEKLQQDLLAMFQELSGISAGDMDPSVSFLELGFDSLFLTQVTQELHNKFALKVTFRQLLDQQSSIAALASYIDSKLPAEAAPVVAQAAKPAPKAGSATSVVALPQTIHSTANQDSASSSALEEMMKEQLRTMSELMARQLDALRGAGATASASLPVSAVAKPIHVQAPPAPAVASTTKEEPKAFGPFKPLSKGPAGGLTPQQEKHIAGLIERYTKKTAESKRLTQKYRKVMADPRVVSGFRSQWKEIIYPLTTVRSEGSKLYDVDGNEYIDILNGYGPTVFGHKPKFVTDAVQKQMELGFEIGPMSPLAGQVAELISEFTGMPRVAFTNTGSEAVLCAIRVARTATGRNKIVMFTGDYHGMFDEVLIRSIKRPGGDPRSTPIAPGIPPQAAENIVVLDYGTAETLEYIRQHAREFAAVLVEPVQSRHPNLQPREFLQELRKITQASETALIFDEVVTGFRSHPGGAQAIFGVRADMATYGKVIGGGMPIGILAGIPQFMDTLDGGMWQYGDDSFPEVGVTFFAGTFVRHPLALAATLSVLQHMKKEGPQLQERLNQKTAKMVARLNAYLAERHVPIKIENFASIFYFSFPTEMRFGSLFYYHMREKGIHIQEGFPCFLTTAHSDADIERVVNAFQESIAELQADDFLPGVGANITKSENVAAAAVVPTNVNAVHEAPLTEVQLEIWLAAQLSDEASLAYNESLTLTLDGRLNEAFLRESIAELISRHDALRTTFTPSGDRQKFSEKSDVEIPRMDFSGSEASQRESRLRELKDTEARTPFDLVKGPTSRFKLVRLSDEQHALVFTAHHIVIDGWSANVLLEELSKLYSAKLANQPAELPKPLSFEAYAKAQVDEAKSPATLANEKYWLEQFSVVPPDLDLPTDRPRPAIRAYEGSTYRKTIGLEVYKDIKKAGAKRGCTLFVTLLSGFQTLLSRLGNQNDVVVGIPTAAQSLLDGETLVGHCVNFLPLRAHIADSMKFSDLLAQQKKSLLDAYEHQTFTYGTLVRKLDLRRDTSRLPLMEVQFNLERLAGDVNFAGLRSEVDPNAKAFVNFDLFLNIVESDKGLVLDCDYNTALYDETTVARWLAHYETLLLSLLTDTDQTVQKVSLLTEKEKQKILLEWNATEADYPQTCVQELFEAQVTRNPEAVAVVFEGKRLTYSELNQKANQVANHLLKMKIKAGLGTDAVVGIYMDRSLEMMVALLGVLKSGAAYLPLDPSYPKERIDFIVGEAKVPVLLTQSHLAGSLPNTNAKSICVDTEWPLIARASSAQPAAKVSPEDLAYVIYTSGSTGKPKGVEISHRAVVNLLVSMSHVPGMDASDTMLAVTTLSFDIAALELFLPLCVGGKLVIVGREVAADPVQLMARLESNQATIMQATPVTWRMLLDAGWDGRPLRKILCGGEALPRELADRLLKLSPELWNMYGPTETTIWSSTSQVKPGEHIAIGPPIANTQFYIVDSQNQQVPIGVPGELCIAGDGVARGYHKRPELTPERFVPNPFRTGTRMYKTGDSARYLPNGLIEFLGRLDHQIKLRGYRIELGEIETVLAKHPDVRQAVAIVREDSPGDQRLVAYWVPKNGRVPAAAELRSLTAEELPNYMVPSAFVKLDSLPLTANGKIDRKALPKPEAGQETRQRTVVAPESDQERSMAQIWSEVLKLDRVGVQEDILELGADSIHIFQITARANAAGLEITARQLLKARTIAALCSGLNSNSSPDNGSDRMRIKRASRDSYRVETGSRR